MSIMRCIKCEYPVDTDFEPMHNGLCAACDPGEDDETEKAGSPSPALTGGGGVSPHPLPSPALSKLQAFGLLNALSGSLEIAQYTLEVRNEYH